MKISSIKKMKYIIDFPRNFKEAEKRPVIIFLHGIGTRGKPIEVLMRNSFFKITDEHENFPFIRIAPLCTGVTWFDMMDELKALVKKISEKSYVDPDRIYLLGNSMGGYGTWYLATSIPEHFAAIIPICGGGMYQITSRLKNVPVWAFHGDMDKTVLLEESQRMVDYTNKNGGNATLTVYPGVAHNCWDITYRNPEVFDWLLSHKRSRKDAENDNYDSKTYG